MRNNNTPTSDGQIRCVPSRKITPDGRFEDLRPPSTNGCRLSRLGYLIGRAPKGRANLVPETRPISRRRQKVDGAPLRGTRWEQTRRGWVGRKSYCATLHPYLIEVFLLLTHLIPANYPLSVYHSFDFLSSKNEIALSIVCFSVS